MLNFKDFLNSIKLDNNKLLLEHIESGFNTLFEGFYPDDSVESYERISTIDRFNTNAANLASTMGNDVLTNIMAASRSRKNTFTVDNETELDNIPTSEFINTDLVNKQKQMPTNKKDEQMGVFFGDL